MLSGWRHRVIVTRAAVCMEGGRDRDVDRAQGAYNQPLSPGMRMGTCRATAEQSVKHYHGNKIEID